MIDEELHNKLVATHLQLMECKDLLMVSGGDAEYIRIKTACNLVDTVRANIRKMLDTGGRQEDGTRT